MFLYGCLALTDPVAHNREVAAITEIAERRQPQLPPPFADLMPTALWIHRLRYLTADSERSRVRVVGELSEQRRRVAQLWQLPDGPSSIPTELSAAIVDTADEAQRLRAGGKKNRDLVDRMVKLTNSLVVDLQNVGWRHPAPRPSLVDPSDLSTDACSAAERWRTQTADLARTLPERFTWLKDPSRPLTDPDGLDAASTSHRPNVGPGRGQVVAFGLVNPDELRERDLDSLARRETSRHRISAWGDVVAELLDDTDWPDDGTITAEFSSTLVNDVIAERFTHATRLYRAGDHDASAHITFPRLEAVIRRAAAARQLPALQIAHHELGKISYLADLLRRIEERSDPSIAPAWLYLRLLLTDDIAAGIRNVLSHGLRSDIGLVETVPRQEAALLIHAAILLASLP